MSALLLVQMDWSMWLGPKAQTGFLFLLPWCDLPRPLTAEQLDYCSPQSSAGPAGALTAWRPAQTQHMRLAVRSVPERAPGTG